MKTSGATTRLMKSGGTHSAMRAANMDTWQGRARDGPDSQGKAKAKGNDGGKKGTKGKGKEGGKDGWRKGAGKESWDTRLGGTLGLEALERDRRVTKASVGGVANSGTTQANAWRTSLARRMRSRRMGTMTLGECGWWGPSVTCVRAAIAIRDA